ncbi:MAG: hypothetical protein V4612_07295 [Pseudomonadota bacterium]
MKYFLKIFSLLIILTTISSCNSYKDQALLACSQPNFFSNYNQYKTNRDKSVQRYASSEKEFFGCDQKYADAFKDAEQKAFASALERANRFLAVCKDDMNREVNYNAPWFITITGDEMVMNYDKYKKRYPLVRNFDVDSLSKCLDYYKNFDENAQRKEIVSKNKEKILMKKYHYQLLWNTKGLSGLTQAIDAGELNIAKAKQYLVKKDNLLFDPDFVVDEVVGNLVIYSNLYDPAIKIALQRYKNEVYARQSNLNGSYFVVIGTKKFMINNKTADILIFKKIL